MITRKQYLAEEATHEEFFGQFVTPALRDYVQRQIGKRQILESKDEHLNDIPLKKWDLLNVVSFVDTRAWEEAHGRTNPQQYHWALSDTVTIAKCAAKQIQDEAGHENDAEKNIDTNNQGL